MAHALRYCNAVDFYFKPDREEKMKNTIIILTSFLFVFSAGCDHQEADESGNDTDGLPDAGSSKKASGDGGASDEEDASAAEDAGSERNTACDDGDSVACSDPVPGCSFGEIPAIIYECWLCVDPKTCHPKAKITRFTIEYDLAKEKKTGGATLYTGESNLEIPYLLMDSMAAGMPDDAFRYAMLPHSGDPLNNIITYDLAYKTVDFPGGEVQMPLEVELKDPFQSREAVDNIVWFRTDGENVVNGYYTGTVRIEEFMEIGSNSVLTVSGENLLFVPSDPDACKEKQNKLGRCPDDSLYIDETCLNNTWSPVDYAPPGPCG